MGRLKDKVAVITGAGAGIGAACMALFAQEGAKVFGISRTKSTLDAVVDKVRAAGGTAMAAAADLANPESAEAAFKAAIAAYGRVDVLVNGAGVGYSWKDVSIGSMEAIDKTTPEKWHEVMSINLDSVFYMSRLAVPEMKRVGGGSIVNIASIYGLGGAADAHTYTVAKAGIINLTRSMCMAYATSNIRANCVAPGFIATKMVTAVLPLFEDPAVAAQISPMCRPGTPEEIAYACLYLASEEASYCNGSVLVADGGSSAH